MDQENIEPNEISAVPKRKSIGKNYIYNLIYQLFLLIVPIAVTPYVARVLGDGGSGQYSFSFSVLTYFTLFAALGFSTYAQREMAKYQGDKLKQSALFWEILIARLVPVVLSLIVYYVLIGCRVYGQEYIVLMQIMAINVLAIAFDIAFFYQANEEFGKMVIINIIVKVLGFVSIFVFVKNHNDLWKYTLIQSLMVLLGYLALWVHLPFSIQKVSIKEIHPWRHLFPTLVLFLPTIATSVYTSLDKTLIGLLVPGEVIEYLDNGEQVVKKIADIENGNYEYAEKLVKMALTVITSLGIVMIPRNTKCYSEGKIEEVERNIYTTLKIVFMIGIPLMLGCIVIADNIIPWYLGAEYSKAANLMKLLSPLILLIGFSNVFGLQFLIPTGKDKQYTIAIVIGALFNVCFNLIFIRYWKSYGAAIATIVAEGIVTIVMYIFVYKHIKFWKILLSSWKYMLAGVAMFVPCFFIEQHLEASILNTFLLAGIGAAIYGVILLILREEFLLLGCKKILKKLKK
ncbi:MAG: flippase [Anaeroplasmataceae bacterium]|nr:flippase [Anaeroplasmataceae bacterium]